jgi:hypothetical protein
MITVSDVRGKRLPCPHAHGQGSNDPTDSDRQSHRVVTGLRGRCRQRSHQLLREPSQASAAAPTAPRSADGPHQVMWVRAKSVPSSRGQRCRPTPLLDGANRGATATVDAFRCPPRASARTGHRAARASVWPRPARPSPTTPSPCGPVSRPAAAAPKEAADAPRQSVQQLDEWGKVRHAPGVR